MAWFGKAYQRWAYAQAPDEDEEGAHCLEEEACGGEEGTEASD